MKLVSAALLALGLISVAACSGSREERVMELPGGGPSEQVAANTEPPGFIDRLIGNDDRANAGPCPLMGVLYEGSRKVEFANPAEERYASITYTGEMQGVQGLCRYVDADPITMSMTINMAFGRGPAATSNEHTYRYWVAVTRRGRMPIEKQYFDINVRFPGDELVVTRTEEIERIVIPRANATTSGENFEVLVGFDLTPEQIAFNRAGKRFRVDAAEQAANP
jgi:hypothetical protein